MHKSFIGLAAAAGIGLASLAAPAPANAGCYGCAVGAGTPNFRQRVPPKWQKGAQVVPRKSGVSRGLPLTKFQIGTRPIA